MPIRVVARLANCKKRLRLFPAESRRGKLLASSGGGWLRNHRLCRPPRRATYTYPLPPRWANRHRRRTGRRRRTNRRRVTPKPARQRLDWCVNHPTYWANGTCRIDGQRGRAIPCPAARHWPPRDAVVRAVGKLARRERSKAAIGQAGRPLANADGRYRVQFHPERDEAADGGWRVTVEKVGHRDGFYDGND